MSFYTCSHFSGDVEVFGETVLTADEIQSLNDTGHLALAFLHIVQGINLKFLRLPFATASSKDKDCVNIPTTTFDQWQKSLLQCSSISALALFYSTLESAVLWTKSRLQVCSFYRPCFRWFFSLFSFHAKFFVNFLCNSRRNVVNARKRVKLKNSVCAHVAIVATIRIV